MTEHIRKIEDVKFVIIYEFSDVLFVQSHSKSCFIQNIVLFNFLEIFVIQIMKRIIISLFN